MLLKLYFSYFNVQSLTVVPCFNIPFTVALEEERNNSPNNGGGGSERGEHLNPKQRHQMKQRELFLSRQVETLPATQIRGRCSVTLLNEEESLLSYLNKDVSSSKGSISKPATL